MLSCKRLVLILFFAFASLQSANSQSFFAGSDTFNKGRFWGIASFTGVTYTATVIGLNELWYKDFPRSKFHTFRDWEEWEQMDKFGHAMTAYFEASYVYDFARWCGMQHKPSVWTAVGLGTLFQATVEILDGYSDAWGFSIGDMAFNTAGVGLFLGQELLWQDQRLLLKISNRFPTYPSYIISNGSATTDLADRADDLFGGNLPARLLKDYNGMTVWLSANPKSFFPDMKWPAFLNIAVGYGTENIYGARSNSWETEEVSFTLDPIEFPRTRQLYLSFDIDLRRIKTKSAFLRFLLRGLNVIKIPSPSLEWNIGQGLKVKPFYF